MVDLTIDYIDGFRKDAVIEAIKHIKDTSRGATVIVCRDISGEHTGGEGCFCDPQIIEIYPEDLNSSK